MSFNKILSKLIRKEDLTKQNHCTRSGRLIYHYCAPSAFWLICSSKSIRLSSIFNMNDSKELIWGRDVMLEMLKNNKHIFPQEFRFFIIINVYNIDDNLLPLIASFSKNGDLLSQWRAYADDAKGFSIGFSEETISNTLPVNMKNISYNQKEQKELIFNSLISFHKYWKKHKEQSSASIAKILTEFSIDLASLKNPSFYEEKEVRIIHLLVKDEDNKSWVDIGGHNVKGESICGTHVLTRNATGKEIPYIDMPLLDSSCIKKVILGAKNPSSIPIVKERLKSIGLKHVYVERSTSTYT